LAMAEEHSCDLLLTTDDRFLRRAMWSRDVARWFRSGLSVSGPFVCRCLISLAVFRFHIPLIEPDMRY